MSLLRLFRPVKLANVFTKECRKSLTGVALMRRPASALQSQFSTSVSERRMEHALGCSGSGSKQSTDSPRSSSEDSSNGEEVPRGELMNFEWKMFPSPWMQMKNWMCEKLIIQPYFDFDFSLKTFKEGATQALVSVSHDLASGRVDALAGRVTPEAVAVLRRSLGRLSLAEQSRLKVESKDISMSFIHQLGVIMEGQGAQQRVFAEVTMCFHIIKNFERLIEKRMKDFSYDAGSAVKENISFANYRFIREITNGVEDDWKINVINHFSPK